MSGSAALNELDHALAMAYQSLSDAALILSGSVVTEEERDSAAYQLMDVKDVLDSVWDALVP